MDCYEDSQKLQHMHCENRLRKTGLFSLEKERPSGERNSCLPIPTRRIQWRQVLCTDIHNRRTRSNVHKLKQGRFQLDINEREKKSKPPLYKHSNTGNRLPREVIKSSSLEIFTWINVWGTTPESSTDPVLSSRLNNRPHDICFNLKNSTEIPQRTYCPLCYHRKKTVKKLDYNLESTRWCRNGVCYIYINVLPEQIIGVLPSHM